VNIELECLKKIQVTKSEVLSSSVKCKCKILNH